MTSENQTQDYVTCRELVELVTEYLEGAMSPQQRAIFEAHLSVCPGCAAYLEQIRQLVLDLGHVRGDSLPADVRDELLSAFRSLRRI